MLSRTSVQYATLSSLTSIGTFEYQSDVDINQFEIYGVKNRQSSFYRSKAVAEFFTVKKVQLMHIHLRGCI